jgi:hypothetical protein
MNDSELDRLLDTWEAPAPPRRLRENVRARYPQVTPRRFRGRMWLTLAAAAAVCGTLAVGMEQNAGGFAENPILRTVGGWYDAFLDGVHSWHAHFTSVQIRNSDPKVYVDGELSGTLEFGNAATMIVTIPGSGVYSLETHGELDGWVKAGRIRGNSIEFTVDGKQVRIECNQPITHPDRPVFVRRQTK